MGLSCRCSALFYKEDSSPWASLVLEQLQLALASATLSADEVVFADVAVLAIVAVFLAALFDDGRETAVEAFLVDGA